MIKWVDQQTFEELLLTNRDAAERMAAEIAPMQETIRKVIPDAVLRYEIVHDEGEHTNRLQRVRVCFMRSGILFYIVKTDYPKTAYRVYADTSGLRYVDRYSEEKARACLTEPNRIGVLTPRKVGEWITYLTQYYDNLERINRQDEAVIAAFTSRLEVLPDVVWNKNHQSGRIERNGLSYYFSIQQTGLSERIELDGRCRTLDDFLRLAENKYHSKN